jgi:hypothetical protein
MHIKKGKKKKKIALGGDSISNGHASPPAVEVELYMKDIAHLYLIHIVYNILIV